MKKILIFVMLLAIIMPISVNASTNKNVKIQFVSNDNQINSVIKFRVKNDNFINDIIYETDSNGIFNGNIELDDAIYELVIVEAPSNISIHSILFDATDSNISFVADFEERTGKVIIERKGTLNIDGNEIKFGPLNDVVYEIYAKEDIISKGSIKYSKDQHVKTIITHNGTATTILPFGNYYVKEREISTFYTLGINIEITLNSANSGFHNIISTVHKPLMIRTNVDYKLCSDEKIVVKNSSFDVLTIDKGTCFDIREYYNLPYGKYRFIADTLNAEIDFREDNDYFEYFMNDKDNTQDKVEEPNKDSENNQDKAEEPDKDSENNQDKVEEPDKDSENNQDKVEEPNKDSENNQDKVEEPNKDSENSQDKVDEPTNNLGKDDSVSSDIKSPTLNKVNSVKNTTSDTKMPVTSSRSNKYSLLISGIVLLILSIIKK